MKQTQQFTLVILAAGIGSRFGGVKQLEPVGTSGELLVDYSIYDAVEAGFNKLVLIIRKDIETDFREVIGRRLEAYCAGRGVAVIYAYQDRNDLPDGFYCPEERQKPWGTGHAVLACRELLDGPFVVINSDDYYGKAVYGQLLAWLKQLPEHSTGHYCLAGFRLRNTLSENGGVTRGICRTDENGVLQTIKETRGIVKTAGGAAVERNGAWVELDPDCSVSMNMWGFTPDLLSALQAQFVMFLREHGQDPKAEFLLPEAVDRMLQEGQTTVQVLPTKEQWFGMTYREDVPPVREAFRQMVEEGRYEKNLYGGE